MRLTEKRPSLPRRRRAMVLLALGISIFALATAPACTDDPKGCPDYTHEECGVLGLDEVQQGYCDECDQLWWCTPAGSGQSITPNPWGCQCLADDGYVYAWYDEGAPPDWPTLCQQDDGYAKSTPDAPPGRPTTTGPRK